MHKRLLHSPYRLKNLELRNRIVLTGHGTGMPTDGTPNDQMVAYYEARAKGGVGLIMLGTQQVHPSSPGVTGLLCNYSDRIIPGLRRVADAVHSHGGRIFGYLGHMGNAVAPRPIPVWSASPTYTHKHGDVAHPMSVDEIHEVTQAFADAAARCLEAGMDGIEVHMAHGLLLQQFLSPLTNLREDEYGGSLENRLRFPSEVLAAVRARIGDDCPLGIRISGSELVPGGLELQDMLEIVPALVAAGRLDFVDVSMGNDSDVVSHMLHEPPMGRPHAPYADHAAALRKALPGVTVIHATRIHTAEAAEALLDRGDADLAGMVRPLIADPELPVKSERGADHEIIPCVACEQACFGRLYSGKHISCVGNPRSGRELEPPFEAVLAPKTVVVVGAGPSGMEAARVAAERGHRVTLIDARSEAGGRMTIARLPAGRQEWDRLIQHKVARLKALGVTMRFGWQVVAEDVLALAPDAVILATGSRRAPIRIPGWETAPLLHVDDAMLNPDLVGQRVLVIDHMNRTPGMATGLHLAGLGRQVSICTEGFQVGSRLVIQNQAHFWGRAAQLGVTFLPGHRVARIEGKQVHFDSSFGRCPIGINEYDSIVLVDPGMPEDSLLAGIREAGIPVRAAGDAYAPRDIEAAFLDGYRAGGAV